MAIGEADTNKSVKQQAGEMMSDLAGEVKHEVHNIRYAKEPVDASQSDVLVRRHVTGISISLFALIAILLLAAIAGIAIYTHVHRGSHPPMPGTSGMGITLSLR